MAVKLEQKLVEKPWGVTRLPEFFGHADGRRVGEVWFAADPELPLLIKYLFTSEPLSTQVHPDDPQARKLGLVRGKSECWLIIDAQPGAVIGLGFRREIDKAELRAAAKDGSIDQLVHWRPVAAGDFLFVPAGTVHAIGAGISLVEVQQNSDATLRLYDRGRSRDLHVDEAVEVAMRGLYPEELTQHIDAGDTRMLVEGPPFSLLHVGLGGGSDATSLSDQGRWVIPLDGTVRADGVEAGPGECLLLEPEEQVDCGDSRVLIASAPGWNAPQAV